MFRDLIEAIVIDAALGAIVAAQAATPPLPNPLNGLINVTSNATGITAAIPNTIWGVTDCTAATGSAMLTCAGELFSTGNDQNKTIIVDDAADSGGNRVPLVTTIASVPGGSGHTVALATAVTYAVPIAHVATLDVDTKTSSNEGTNYAFGTTQTLTCGSCVLAPVGSSGGSAAGMAGSLATGTPAVMTAVGVSIAGSRKGNGGTPSTTCTVSASDQIALGGHVAQFMITTDGSGGIQGGSMPPPITIVSGGFVTAISGNYAAGGSYLETVSGCGGIQNASLYVSYGVVLEQINTTPAGAALYTTPPACVGTSIATTSTSAVASGLMLQCNSNYTSTSSWGSDNTAALSTALNQMNGDSMIAAPRCLYFPAGNYLIKPLNTAGNLVTSTSGAVGYGCYLGDEHNQTNIFVIPSAPGDVFAWLDASNNGSLPDLANTQTFSNVGGKSQNMGGSAFRNITVIGDRASTVQQNALVFYGKTDHAYIDNVTVAYMKGLGLGAGYGDNGFNKWGNMTETVISNARFEHDGLGPTIPAVEITATNTEGSNNLNLLDMRFYQSLGTGLLIHNGSAVTQNARGIRIANFKAEGSKVSNIVSSAGLSGDLIKLGDTSLDTNNNVSDVLGRNVELVNPPIGFAALHIVGEAAAKGNTSNIDISGTISDSGGYGRGAQIETCVQCETKWARNGSTDYNLMLGSPVGISAPGVCASANISSPGVVYDGNGAEAALTSCIDPTVATLLQFPARQTSANASAQTAYPPKPLDQISNQANASAGGTLTFGSVVPVGVGVPLWTVVRTGPTAAFTDTWDTANDIVAAIQASGGSAYVAAGQVYRLRVCNQTSASETLVAPTGGGTVVTPSTTLAPGTCSNFALEIGVVGSGSTSSTVTIVGG